MTDGKSYSEPPSLGGIDIFLAGRNEINRGEALRLAWARAFDERLHSLPDLEELAPYRLMAAWRLVRRLGMYLGAIAEDETLLEATTSCKVDPWADRIPSAAFDRVGIDPALLRGHDGRGLTLLPPPIPVDQLQVPGYDATNELRDPALHAWLRAMAEVADEVSLDRHKVGLWGMQGLFDARLARRLWPQPQDLMAFESTMIEELLALSIKAGASESVKVLASEYGIGPNEGRALLQLADAEAVRRAEATVDVHRARIVARIEQLIHEADEAEDLKTRRWLLKDLALVTGVTRASPQDMNREMLDAVRRAAKADDEPEGGGVLPSDANTG